MYYSSGPAEAVKAASAIRRPPPLISKLNAALHVSVALTALSIAIILFDSSLFSFHPALMSIGYVIFMAEGVISSIMFRHIEPGAERVKAIQSHALLQLRAVVCIAIGFGVIYRNKVIHGKTHFKSLHAKFGLATLILSVVLPLGGALSFRKLGFIQRFPDRWQARIKALHRQGGMITFLMSLVTIELALPHKSVNKGMLTMAWQAGIALIGAMVLLLSLKTTTKVKGGQDEPKSV